MGVVSAKCVISQHLYDAALADAAMAFTTDHPFQLFAQRGELSDFCLHLGEVAMNDRIRFGTGTVGIRAENDQFANLINLETELSGVADKFQPSHILKSVTPLPTLAAGWRSQQANAFIKADCRHFHAGFIGQLPN